MTSLLMDQRRGRRRDWHGGNASQRTSGMESVGSPALRARALHPATLLGLLYLALNGPATAIAAVTTTEIVGSFNEPQENGCTLISAFYYGVDCSYAPEPASGADRLWIGPTETAVYFERDAPEAAPTYSPRTGDGRIAPALSGSIAIDDRDTSDPLDDEISAAFSIEPGARSLLVSPDPGRLIRAVESWGRIRHTMPATRVSAAGDTAQGGVEYVIGAKGWPQRLCRKDTPAHCFPIADGPLVTDGRWGSGIWATPGDISIARGRLLGGNPGAHSTQVVDDYQCADKAGGRGCRNGVGLWRRIDDSGLSNILLRVAVDSDRRVTRLEGFWTYEFRIDAGPPGIRGEPFEVNSWVGGYLHGEPKLK